MKTLCVAVVVLSLVSVGQSASLACEVLLQPVVQGPEVTGRWYLIALSSNYCWATAILNSLVAPSIHVDVASTGKQHYYDVNLKIKISEFCDEKTFSLIYKDNTIAEASTVSDGQRQTDDKYVLTVSQCQDCIVLKDNAMVNMFAILSRRPNITAEEMKGFEAQAECLSLYRPQVLNSDHDFENCKSMENNEKSVEFDQSIPGRVRNLFSELFTCTTEKFLYYPRVIFGWAQQTWASIW